MKNLNESSEGVAMNRLKVSARKIYREEKLKFSKK